MGAVRIGARTISWTAEDPRGALGNVRRAAGTRLIKVQADARAAKGLISGFVSNPLDTAAEKLLIPAVTSILWSH
jgi:hypothetical protein